MVHYCFERQDSALHPAERWGAAEDCVQLGLAGVDDTNELEQHMPLPERSCSTDGTCHIIGDQNSWLDAEPAETVTQAAESSDWCGDGSTMMAPHVLDEVHAADGMRSHGDPLEEHQPSSGVTGQGVMEQAPEEDAQHSDHPEDTCGDDVLIFADLS